MTGQEGPSCLLTARDRSPLERRHIPTLGTGGVQVGCGWVLKSVQVPRVVPQVLFEPALEIIQNT